MSEKNKETGNKSKATWVLEHPVVPSPSSEGDSLSTTGSGRQAFDIARKYAYEMGFFPLNLAEVVQEAIDNNTLGGRAAKEKLGYSPEESQFHRRSRT